MSSLLLEIELTNRRLIIAAVIVAGVLIVACGGSSPNPSAAIRNAATDNAEESPPVDTREDFNPERLEEMYRKRDCRGFIEAFPGQFDVFTKLYGFDPARETLFPKYDDHFRYFVDCPEVTDREKLLKVIAISFRSEWDENVPSGQFGEAVYDLILRNAHTVSALLDELPDERASAFWYFLFDRPHPSDKENVKRVGMLIEALGEHTRQGRLLAQQHERLVSDWKDH